MANKLIAVRMPNKLITEANKAAAEDDYASTQEFIRECIRKALQERRKSVEETLIELDKLAGSVKGKKIRRMTPDERDALAREFTRHL